MQQQTAIRKPFAEKALITAVSAVLFFGTSAVQAMSHGGAGESPLQKKQVQKKQVQNPAPPPKVPVAAAPAADESASATKQAANPAQTEPASAEKKVASGIYNLKTKAKGAPEDPFGKYWLLVAEGCRSCDQVLSGIKTICSGKSPAPGKISFFVTGQSEKKMLKKLKDYAGYDVFSGSTADMFSSYGFQDAPALLAKEKGKIISGKSGILSTLKKDGKLCAAAKPAPAETGKKAGA